MLSLFMAISLLFPTLANAKLEDRSGELEKALRGFEAQSFVPENQAGLRAYGEYVSRFIRDPQNQQTLDSPDGQELVRRQARLLNYVSILDSMSRGTCRQLLGKQKANPLLALVQESAGRSDLGEVNERTCDQLFKPASPFSTQPGFESSLSQINSLAEHAQLKDMADDLYVADLKRMVDRFLDLNARYSATSGDLPAIPDARSYIDSLCKTSSHCPKEELLRHARAHAATLRTLNMRTASYAEAANEINEHIDRLNAILARMKYRVDPAWIKIMIHVGTVRYDNSSVAMSEQAKQVMSEYLREVEDFQSAPTAPLLETRYLEKKARTFYDLTAEMKDHPDASSLRHRNVQPDDIRLALLDRTKEDFRRASRLATAHNEKLARDHGSDAGSARNFYRQSDALKGALSADPSLVGALLLEHPEHTNSVCELAGQIVDEQNKDKALVAAAKLTAAGVGVMAGGYTLLGGALGVMGGGEATLGWLLGSEALGTAGAATLTGAGNALGTAGFLATTGSALGIGLNYHEAAAARRALAENLLYSPNRAAVSKAYGELSRQNTELYIEGAKFLAFDMNVIGAALAASGSAGRALSQGKDFAEALRGVQRTTEKLAKRMPLFERVLLSAARSLKVGPRTLAIEFNKFAVYVSRIPEAQREILLPKLLEKFEKWGLKEGRLDKVYEAIHEAVLRFERACVNGT